MKIGVRFAYCTVATAAMYDDRFRERQSGYFRLRMLPPSSSENRAPLVLLGGSGNSWYKLLCPWKHFLAWLLLWSATGFLVLSATMFGHEFVKSRTSWDLIDSFARRDGQHYKQIAEKGYEYQADQRSAVAFFPAYPLLVRVMTWLTGLSIVPAMLAVSNLSLLTAFMLMGNYLRRDCASSSLGQSDLAGGRNPRQSLDAGTFAMLAMGAFPTAFFFRMAYSESLFLCICILFMAGIHRTWPLPAIALLAGLETAVRPVGVALMLPLVWHIVSTCDSAANMLRRLAYAIPLGCWGLILYMAFQYWQFGETFAFALTQGNWRLRPDAGIVDKLWSLASWEPIWSGYVPGSAVEWRRFDGGDNALFSMQFANPIYFVLAVALVVVGAWNKWLDTYETLLSVALLAIPYVTRSYEMCMASQGRFAVVVFPIYIVMGQLLARMPRIAAIGLLALSGVMMGIYAALFAADYMII